MQKLPRPLPLDVLTQPVWFAGVLLALSAALSALFADRTMPIPDEGALLTAAVKILHGGVFYRDVDAYAFPGVSYLLAGAMAVFGEHLSVARTVAGSIFCVMVLGTYACALALVDQKRAALCGLSLLSLKFLAFPIYTMFFYADAALAAAILALALFLRHRFEGASQRLFWVGVMAGLSIITKQSTGILVAVVFGVVLCFPGFAHGPRRRGGRVGEVLAFGAGLLLILGAMSVYFASHGLFGDMFREGLLRPFSGYLPTSGISFIPPLAWWNFGNLQTNGPVYFAQLYFELVLRWAQLDPAARSFYFGIGEIATRLLYGGILLTFVLSAASWIRFFRTAPPDAENVDALAFARLRFFTTAGVCLAITISAFPRADFIHVITIYPAIVLTAFALCRQPLLGLGWTERIEVAPNSQTRRRRLESAIVALLLMTMSVLSVRYDAMLTHRINLDRADIWVKPQHAWLASLVSYVREHVPEGEPFFVYGHEAQWYFLTDRYTPRAFSQLYPGMTGDETGEQLAALVSRTRPRIVAQGVLRWPGMPDVRGYTGELARTLEQLYVVDPSAVQPTPRPQMLRVWQLRDQESGTI